MAKNLFFKISTKELILIISLFVSIIVTIAYFIFFEFDMMGLAYIGLAVICLMLFPIALYDYSLSQIVKKIEIQFPMFLKDLADNLKAGLSISDAIKSISRNDYGAFNPEIKRLSNQVSWGVSFENAINDMIKKLDKSIFVARGLSILLQAFKSGGDISPIMNSIAESTVLLQDVQKNQETQMLQQISIIYMIQLVFIGIIIILFKVLIPITSSDAFSLSIGDAPIQGSSMGNEYYKGFFFLTIVIQSVCNGLVAGYTKDNNLVAGVKHIGIMLGFSLLLYTVFILPKTLTISASSDSYSVLVGGTFRVIGTAKYDDSPAANASIIISLENQTFSGATSSSGGYDIKVVAPSQRGSYEGLAIIEHDGKKEQAGFTINVR